MKPTTQISTPVILSGDVVLIKDIPHSFVIERDGRYIYFLAPHSPQEDYIALRDKITVDYRMADFTDTDGVYRCTMESERGEKRVMHFRAADVFANLAMVGSVMDTIDLGVTA